jgi:hypothetical protein
VKNFVLIVLVVSLAACGKKEEPAPSVVADQSEQPPVAAPARAPTARVEEDAPVIAAKQQKSMEDALQGTIHPEMTLRLQMFLQVKGRMPQNFYELQNMGGFDSTPGLPPAFKYEIDPKDKTVKIVRK